MWTTISSYRKEPCSSRLIRETLQSRSRRRKPISPAPNINIPITSVNTASQLQATTSDVASSTAGIVAAERQAAAAHAQLEQAQAHDGKMDEDRSGERRA